jgi:hypothetical protein
MSEIMRQSRLKYVGTHIFGIGLSLRSTSTVGTFYSTQIAKQLPFAGRV